MLGIRGVSHGRISRSASTMTMCWGSLPDGGNTWRALKEKNIRFQTIYPARPRVFHEDVTKIYETVEEVMKDLADRGLPVTVISNQLRS